MEAGCLHGGLDHQEQSRKTGVTWDDSEMEEAEESEKRASDQGGRGVLSP